MLDGFSNPVATMPEEPVTPEMPQIEMGETLDIPVPMDGVDSEEIEKAIIDKAVNFLRDSDNYRHTYEDEWFDFYELFTDYREDKDEEDKWQSNLHIPITSTLIYQMLPRLTGAFINPLKFFARIMPNNIRNPEDCIKAEKTEKIIQVQFRRMQFARTMVDTLLDLIIYGNAFQKVAWKTEEKMLKRKTQQLSLGGARTLIQRVPVKTFDGPMVTPIDLFYFFPDTQGKDEEMRRYIHVTYLSEYELKQLEQNTIRPTDHEELGDYSQYNTYADERRTNVDAGDSHQSKDTENQEYELMEYYCDGVFTFILNRKKIVRREIEPFFGGGSNLVVYKFLPRPNELYAAGLPKLVKTINEDVNYLHNGMQDWLTLLLKRPFFADINRLEDPTADIEIEPFGIIGVAGGENINNVIKPMDIPGMDSSVPGSIQFLQSMAQMVSGINDYMMGRDNQGGMAGGNTATGVSIITRQSLNRLEFHSSYIAMTAVMRIIDRMIMLNHQYLTEEQTFIITDDMQPIQAGPEDLVLDYDIVPRIDSGQATKEIDRQQFMQALQTISSIPPMAQEQNWRKLTERVYKMFDVENPGELLLTEQEKQQNMMLQQQAQMQNLQMQQAAKMPPGGAAPPPSSPPGGTPPNPPPYGSDEDMQRMVARAMIGNGDRNFENV